ncbi:MAG: hypothetical protein KME57_32345 [Scytonema hyalinum WJT4-NPBG1]|jgi:hypothetical protein|nr:hypothetical protein [Scytonema hyalinum WJT4-NPBG1]
MSKIQYPTLDLFVYNLAEGLASKIEDYWVKLPDKLKEKGYSTKINDEDSQRLDFWKTISAAVDGSYSRVNFEDTNCLRYCCSLDQEIELSDIALNITQIKDLAILPEVEDLPTWRLSDNGYLGQTCIISGWTDPAHTPISESIAPEAYKALIGQEHQHQQSGEFLGATVYEMWRGEGRWDGIVKDSHVIIIFYPDEATFAKAAKYNNDWRYLFYCRHKILWAYEQGRELKLQLLQKYKHSLIDINSISDLSKKGLHELKIELQKNINTVSRYVQEINLLQTQQHTVEVNWRNYENKRCKEDIFKNEKFLEEFSKVVKDKYQVQLEKDYLSLNPGLVILENVTATIRGMVEIEEAQRDRNLNNTVAIAGVGLATSQIASSIIVAQETPPKNIPFLQTSAFWTSIAAGIVASLILWSLLHLYRLISRFRR